MWDPHCGFHLSSKILDWNLFTMPSNLNWNMEMGKHFILTSIVKKHLLYAFQPKNMLKTPSSPRPPSKKGPKNKIDMSVKRKQLQIYSKKHVSKSQSIP